MEICPWCSRQIAVSGCDEWAFPVFTMSCPECGNAIDVGVEVEEVSYEIGRGVALPVRLDMKLASNCRALLRAAIDDGLVMPNMCSPNQLADCDFDRMSMLLESIIEAERM